MGICNGASLTNFEFYYFYASCKVNGEMVDLGLRLFLMLSLGPDKGLFRRYFVMFAPKHISWVAIRIANFNEYQQDLFRQNINKTYP